MLDVGCAVGGTSFELSAHFNEVVGLDYSQHFVDAANLMKDKSQVSIDILKQGEIFQQTIVKLSEHVDRSKVSFLQGDACHLDPSLGSFIFSS